MEWRKTIVYIFLLLSIGVNSCKDKEIDGVHNIGPIPERYLDVQVIYKKLPNYLQPSEVVFTITVVGNDYKYPINFLGDTLTWLYLRLESSDWLEGINAVADTLWYDEVKIGQKIILNPEYKIIKEGANYSTIYLKWGLFEKETPLDSILNMVGPRWLFIFNHRTGEYILTDH